MKITREIKPYYCLACGQEECLCKIEKRPHLRIRKEHSNCIFVCRLFNRIEDGINYSLRETYEDLCKYLEKDELEIIRNGGYINLWVTILAPVLASGGDRIVWHKEQVIEIKYVGRKQLLLESGPIAKARK